MVCVGPQVIHGAHEVVFVKEQSLCRVDSRGVRRGLRSSQNALLRSGPQYPHTPLLILCHSLLSLMDPYDGLTTTIPQMIVSHEIGDLEADLGVGSMFHPFDSHRLVFAVDFEPPSESTVHWPIRKAFSSGFEGWAWNETGESLCNK